MSHYLYLQCESHQPPIQADRHSGNHLADLDQITHDLEHRNRLVAAWEDGFTPTGMERHATISFLAQHPHCTITVIDEYGDTQHPKGDTE